MCLTDRIQVDTTKKTRIFTRFHVVLEYTNNYFGSTATCLATPVEQENIARYMLYVLSYDSSSRRSELEGDA